MTGAAGGYAFTMPVEAGHVKIFQRAIGGPEPDWADLRPGASVEALTFLQAADHFDPAYPRRPREGRPWIGSSRAASGFAPDAPEHEAALHVDQRFEYSRRPRIGETLTVRRAPVRRWTKQGRRGGALRFEELETTFVAADGGHVATAIWRDVVPERSHAQLSTEAGSEETSGEREGATPPGREVVRDLTLTRIVMYVGAAGDFHPLHHDSPYVHARGYPGVFVPGMLTMALAGRVLSEEAKGRPVVGLDARFLGQVWPGDSLFADLRAEPDRIEATLRNQAGRAVLEASARLGDGEGAR